MSGFYIVSKWDNTLWSICFAEDKVAQTIDEAIGNYRDSLKHCASHIVDYPKNAEYWTDECYRYVMMLRGGFEAISQEEYRRREREKWLSKKAEKITLEHYREMEPFAIRYHLTDNYELYNNREMTSDTFTTQYARNRKTNECYCATVDIRDKSTWIPVKFFNEKIK